MNIFTAPAIYLLRTLQNEDRETPIPSGPYTEFQLERQEGGPAGCFLMVTILIAVALVGVGLYLAIVGGSGGTEVSGMGITLKTEEAGLGLAAFGALFWLAAGKMIMTKEGR